MFKCGQISNKFIQKTFQATLSINFCKIFARYWIPFISRPSLTNGNMTLVWFPQKNVTKRDDIRCILSRVTANSTVRWEQVPKYILRVRIHGVGGKKIQIHRVLLRVNIVALSCCQVLICLVRIHSLICSAMSYRSLTLKSSSHILYIERTVFAVGGCQFVVKISFMFDHANMLLLSRPVFGKAGTTRDRSLC